MSSLWHTTEVGIVLSVLMRVLLVVSMARVHARGPSSRWRATVGTEQKRALFQYTGPSNWRDVLSMSSSMYTDENASNFPVDNTRSMNFTKSFRYMGSIIHHSLTSDGDVDYWISKASAAFGALSNAFRNQHVSNNNLKFTSSCSLYFWDRPRRAGIRRLTCRAILFFMGVRFGAYEKTYSTDSEASIGAVSVARIVSVFIVPSVITSVQPLLFKGLVLCCYGPR